jgi:FlaA1/EpsC-like NDP-sugar epimerase
MKISSKLENYFTIILKILIDISLCIICTWVAFVLRIEEFRLIFDKLENYNFDISVMFTFIAIPIFWMFGLYRTFFRQPNLSIILIITYSIVVYGLIYFSIISIYVIDGVPRSIGVLQPILLFLSNYNFKIYSKISIYKFY